MIDMIHEPAKVKEGWTIGEVKRYRRELYLAVEKFRKNAQIDAQKSKENGKEIASALGNEILILIAEFYNESKNVNYDVSGSIVEALQESLIRHNVTNVRIEYIRETFRRDEVKVIRAIGKSYNATAFIWGHYDDGGMFPRYTILQEDRLIILAKVEAKLANLVYPPDDFPLYVHRYLPFQMAYLVQFTLGQIHFWKENYYEARTSFEDALAYATPANADEIQESLANLHFYLGFISIALDEGYEKIRHSFTKGIKLNPKHPGAYINRAVASLRLGDIDQALADFSKVIDLDVDSAPGHYGRGVAYLDLGQLDKAILDFTEAIRIDKKSADAYYNRGNAYRVLGDFDKAIADYSKAIDLNPSYVDVYYNRGIAYSDLGDWQQALEDYDTVLELDSGYVPAYNTRGNLYKKLGNKEAALQEYYKALELNSGYAIIHYNLGKLHAEAGNLEDAISSYDKAIECDSKYAKAYYNLGNTYLLSGQLEKALLDYSKSIELEPNYAGAYVNRGNIYKDLGDLQEAISDYNKAIKLDPNLLEAYFNRAHAYIYLDQVEQVISDFQRYLELAPDAPNKYEVIAKIEIAKQVQAKYRL